MLAEAQLEVSGEMCLSRIHSRRRTEYVNADKYCDARRVGSGCKRTLIHSDAKFLGEFDPVQGDGVNLQDSHEELYWNKIG